MSDENDPESLSLNEAIDLFKSSRRIGSRALFRELGEKLVLGQGIDLMTSQYIGFALLDLSEGLSVTKAFNMQPTGRPRDKDLFKRDLIIAIDVYEMMHKGVSFERASFEVAERRNVSDSTAEKAYKQHAHRFKATDNIEEILKFRDKLTPPSR